MNPEEELAAAVGAVAWQNNVQGFVGAAGPKEAVARSCYRVALWSKQLENVDATNPALVFVREAQVQGHYAAALIALGLYKPSASAARAMVESMLYYSFFRTHRSELETLVRDDRYYVSKHDILQYHGQHTAGFKDKQAAIGFVSLLTSWYSEISAIVHGQIPGKWNTHTRLEDICYDGGVCKEAASSLEMAADVSHRLMLCTIDKVAWRSFSVDAKREILKGVSADARSALDLPEA